MSSRYQRFQQAPLMPTPALLSRFKLSSPALQIALCVAVVAGLTLLRAFFAVSIELPVDQAYYWTWSRENVVSFLDHPPLIAWLIRFGTALFGDTNFGVRFPGLVAMLAMQLLLAAIVWRVLRDYRYVIAVVLMTEAAPVYGLMMAKLAPDTALIPCELVMIWALVRLAQSGDQRWWLPAGFFGGLALASKYTAVLLAPAILAFVLVPAWRRRQLAGPWLWIALVLALLAFSPVLYWNAIHDWASFKFQLDRPPQVSGWSARYVGEFIGQQFALVGFVLFPVVIVASAMLAMRGYRNRDPVAILLSTAVIVPLIFCIHHALTKRVGDSWPLFVWPIGFACAAINLKQCREEVPQSRLAQTGPGVTAFAIATGIVFVAAAHLYYIAGSANYLGKNDPIGKEASFGAVVSAADRTRLEVGAGWFVVSDYRMYAMLRWHLRDKVAVVQINERSRYLDFQSPALPGPAGLYVAPKDTPRTAHWNGTGAKLQPVGSADLAWRGVVYDTYVFQRVTDWKPVFSPPPGDPLYEARPN